VFRDQEYGADTYSRAVTRIKARRCAQQFRGRGPDEAPGAAAVYVEIRNFYTMTVYEKGASGAHAAHPARRREVQAGMKLYFRRHDSQAVTCTISCKRCRNLGRRPRHFKRWYDVAGTRFSMPRVQRTGSSLR
jgi:aminopeptidase N